MMVDLGVIEPSSSEWCSPVVLVPKKDGTLRFCVDFSKLNSVSAFDPYPMPRVDELIERLGKAKYLTTLDLCKGYWQVPLTETAKELTAFRVPSGLYHFNVMPFGLHGAAATFQRLVDQVLRGMDDVAAAYLDDIVVFSATWKEHLEHLAEVFDRLQGAGLVANAKKCHIAKSEVSYLGYVLGGGSIRPQVDKVQAILSCPLPSTKKRVRSFLGMAGWYRRFIPNFSSRAAVLTDLTKKNSPKKVAWTPECEQAFRDLKDCLCNAPVLQSPDFSMPFTVQTDASEVGLGAVLLQGEGETRHPVLYISRKLFPRETRPFLRFAFNGQVYQYTVLPVFSILYIHEVHGHGFAPLRELDSVAMTVDTIRRLAASFQLGSAAPLKTFQRMLGCMASAAAVLQLGLLRMRPLQRWLNARVPHRAWASGGIRLQRGVTMGAVSHRKVISTEASNLGWGALFEGKPVFGLWSDQEKCLHINCLEIIVIKNALKRFLPHIRDHHVLVRSDNMSMVSYVNRQGGVRSRNLGAVHVPGHLNVGPDRLSRDNIPPGEWFLHPQTVQLLWHLFGRAEVNLFGSKDNAHCPMFFSKSEDVLAQTWPSRPLYAFPPISLLPQVIKRIRETRHSVLLIAP
ncbi:hypothetical protein PO909_007906 [Leuciscus waleckii]